MMVTLGTQVYRLLQLLPLQVHTPLAILWMLLALSRLYVTLHMKHLLCHDSMSNSINAASLVMPMGDIHV